MWPFSSSKDSVPFQSFNSDNNYDEWRKSVIRERRRKAVLAGYVSGQVIGTTAYVISAGRRFSPGAALGSGAFLGVCLGFGAFIQTF